MNSILPQSMSWHLHLNTIQVSHVSIQVPIHESDLHLGPYIKFYTPSRSCITFTAVQRLASQPHSGPTWLPSRSRYLHPTSIHVPIWAFPHPGNIAPPPRPWDFVLITIHVLKFASQHHSVNASHASMSRDFASPPHPGLKTCTSPPSRSCPTCIQVPRFASGLPACCISLLYGSHHLGPKNCISIQVPSHLHLGLQMCLTSN